jgi:hypothetical protein
LTVPRPYWPSVDVLKPAELSSVCSALTREPWSPERSGLEPTLAAAAAVAVTAVVALVALVLGVAVVVGAAVVPGAAVDVAEADVLETDVSAAATTGKDRTATAERTAPNADERNGDGDNWRYPSISGAYGVSCRARANRAALLRGVSR